MYLASTVLKHFENQGRRAVDLPLVEWSVRTLMYHAQEQLHGFLRNFPNRPVAFLLRWIIFPRGRTYSAPADDLGQKIVSLITQTGEARDRLSAQAYKARAANSPLGLLQEALELSEKYAPMELKLKQARKEGLITAEYLGHQIEQAAAAEIISDTEAEELRGYHGKVMHLLSVDDFAPDEMRPQWVAHGRARESGTSAPNAKKAGKKTSRKKVARKSSKANSKKTG